MHAHVANMTVVIFSTPATESGDDDDDDDATASTVSEATLRNEKKLQLGLISAQFFFAQLKDEDRLAP